jgi:hypothetical protein
LNRFTIPYIGHGPIISTIASAPLARPALSFSARSDFRVQQPTVAHDWPNFLGQGPLLSDSVAAHRPSVACAYARVVPNLTLALCIVPHRRKFSPTHTHCGNQLQKSYRTQTKSAARERRSLETLRHTSWPDFFRRNSRAPSPFCFNQRPQTLARPS